MKRKNLVNIVLLLMAGALVAADLLIDTPEFGTAFTQFRLPRVMAAFITGICLSMCGLALQTLFRNPLAGPFLTGVTPGASFTVALLLMAGGGVFAGSALLENLGLAASGMIGGAAVLLIQLSVSRRHGGMFTLLLTGVLLGYLFGAGVEILQSFAGAEQLKSYTMWGLGSFSIPMKQIPFYTGIALCGTLWIVYQRHRLDAYLPGDTYAQNAGVDLQRLRLGLILATGLMAGASTGFCGPIGFVGMVAPHLARALIKSNSHGQLWLTTALCGAVLCLLADTVAHFAVPGIQLNVNAVCALLGAPMVLWVILRSR